MVIAVTVAILVVIFGAFFIGKKQVLPNSPIFSIAIVLVVLGISFGDDSLISAHPWNEYGIVHHLRS